MKFFTLQHTGVLDAPVKAIWQILAEDFGAIDRYSDGVRESRYLTERTQGAGVQRYCNLDQGGFMKEEISRWDEGSALEIQILDSSFPIQPGSTLLFHLKPRSEHRTQVNITGEYRFRRFGIPFASDASHDEKTGRRLFE